MNELIKVEISENNEQIVRARLLHEFLDEKFFSDNLKEDSIFDLRPEQLSVEQFIEITQKIAADGV